jgi:hypothetical protein
MKCFTLEGHLVLRNGIELKDGYLILGENGQGREENSIKFEESRIKIMDEYYKKIYHYYSPDGKFIGKAFEFEKFEKYNHFIKIYGEDNVIERPTLIRYLRMAEYQEEEPNDVLVYFKRPEYIKSILFIFKDGVKYKIIRKGICAEGETGRDGRWGEYLIQIQDGGWVSFRLRMEGSVLYPFYQNIKGRIVYFEKFKKPKRIKIKLDDLD